MTALWKPPTKTVEPTGDQQHAVNRQIGVNVMLFASGSPYDQKTCQIPRTNLGITPPEPRALQAKKAFNRSQLFPSITDYTQKEVIRRQPSFLDRADLSC